MNITYQRSYHALVSNALLFVVALITLYLLVHVELYVNGTVVGWKYTIMLLTTGALVFVAGLASVALGWHEQRKNEEELIRVVLLDTLIGDPCSYYSASSLTKVVQSAFLYTQVSEAQVVNTIESMLLTEQLFPKHREPCAEVRLASPIGYLGPIRK